MVATQTNIIAAHTHQLNALVMEHEAINAQLAVHGVSTVHHGSILPTVATVSFAVGTNAATGTTAPEAIMTTVAETTLLRDEIFHIV